MEAHQTSTAAISRSRLEMLVDGVFAIAMTILVLELKVPEIADRRSIQELARSIAQGFPVVSISLGDTARFLFGGVRRRDPVDAIPLESGDAFVFGGPARLRYHGVSRIVPGTAPVELDLSGRFNLTLRQY